MSGWWCRMALTVLAGLCGWWSVAAHAQADDRCVEVHFARGSSSAAIRGNSSPETADCYTFRAAEGQTAHLHVTGRNMIVSVIGVGDARVGWTFTTHAQDYRFLVSQLFRSVTAEPYEILLRIDPAARCGLNHLALCRNTNQLVSEKRFVQAVATFVGNRRAAYLYETSVADQLLEVLHGPPDDVQRIGALYRFTACRAHSCEEKGAAVLAPDGRVVALGILHSNCGAPRPSSDCSRHETLTLFVRDPARRRGVIADLSDWAQSEVGDSYVFPGMKSARLDGVRVVTVQ